MSPPLPNLTFMTNMKLPKTPAQVYRVDTRVGPPANALKIVSPGSRVSGDIRNQQALKLGESVSYGGWTIEVVDAGRFGDVVKLSKS